MAKENNEPVDYSSIVQMTDEQKKAYNEFIDYMAYLYREFAYLLEEDQEKESVS